MQNAVQAVHPRACGEHTSQSAACASCGSSPRLRGTHDRSLTAGAELRFIPAPAGNTALAVPHTRPTVHPRACGEHAIWHWCDSRPAGSSPRLRGTHDLSLAAGVGAAVHPRACGEHRSERAFATRSSGSSPRLRGTLYNPPLEVRHHAVHPRACGEHMLLGGSRSDKTGSSPRLRGTRAATASASARSVHPRACGEHLA